jgi:hypothetical protein
MSGSIKSTVWEIKVSVCWACESVFGDLEVSVTDFTFAHNKIKVSEKVK